MTWLLFALLAAFGAAGMRLVNQHYAVSGFHLAILVKIVLALVTVPFALFLGWPQSPVFYLAVCATIPLIIFGDQMVFNLCARYGSGPVSRVEPLDNVIIFILWSILNFSLLISYIQEPVRFGLIALSIMGSVLFAYNMRESRVSLKVLKSVFPLVVAMALVNILNKLAMDASVGENGVLIYIFLQSALVGGAGLCYMAFFARARALSVIGDMSFIKACVIISFFSLVHISTKANAFILVENPAYVTVINLTAPVWILLYNRMTGYPDNIKILPGLGIVLCAFVLILATHL